MLFERHSLSVSELNGVFAPCEVRRRYGQNYCTLLLWRQQLVKYHAKSVINLPSKANKHTSAESNLIFNHYGWNKRRGFQAISLRWFMQRIMTRNSAKIFIGRLETTNYESLHRVGFGHWMASACVHECLNVRVAGCMCEYYRSPAWCSILSGNNLFVVSVMSLYQLNGLSLDFSGLFCA